MAEKILNTRILMKVDTLENWSKSALKLKKGELAFATVASSAGTGLEEPVVMVKIGTDEEKTFSELPWAFHAKASDVLAACKTEAGLKAFVNSVIADAGIASDEAMEELAGRVTTAEGKITALEGTVGDATKGLVKGVADNAAAIEVIEGRFGADTVAAEIEAAIKALKLEETYAAKSLETTVDNHVKDTVAHVTADDKVKWNNALQATDVVTGSANGTITVKGSDVAVKGLGSAAYTEASAYEVSGAAAKALKDAKDYADGLAGNYDAAGSAAAAQAAAEATAKAYADGLASNYDAAGSADDALEAAKEYVDGLVGDEPVSDYVSGVIANYTTTADMNTAIGNAESAAKTYADGLNTAMDARVKTVEGKAHEHSFVESELNLIQAGDVAKWNAAEQNAKTYADGLNTAMDSRVDALEAKFEGDDSVADQIEAAVAAEAALREAADEALQGQIGEASAEGKAATGLHAKIEAVDAELERLTGGAVVSEAIAAAVKVEKERAEGEEARIVGLVEAEATKAREEEGKLDARLDKVEAFFEGAAEDGEGLQNALDTLVEIQTYVDTHGEAAAKMVEDIAANKKAIEDHAALDHDFAAADATLKSELEGKIALKADQTALDGVAGRMTTAEGEIDALQAELDTAETGLKARMTTAEADIDALEGLVGDKKVSVQITDVTNPLAERVVALEAVDHSHANAAELDKFVDGDKAKLDSALQSVTAAAGSGLKATQTGTGVDIAFDETVTFIFDCGGADVE